MGVTEREALEIQEQSQLSRKERLKILLAMLPGQERGDSSLP